MKFPFNFKSKSAIELKSNDLQEQIDLLTNQLEEKEEDNLSLFMNKSIIDSNGSEPIAGQFGLVDEQYDKAMLQKLYMTETWFYIVVSTIAKTIASLPFKLEKKKMVKQVVTHPDGSTEDVYKETWIDAGAEPEANLFYNPNDIQTQMEFWMLIVIDLLSTGDAFIHPYKDQVAQDSERLDRLRNSINQVRGTDIQQLWRINSAMVEIAPSEKEDEILGGYVLMSDEQAIHFNPDEMIHMKLPNPSNPFYGLAPIVGVMKKVLLDRYTDEHHMRFYKQGARLGGAIETTKKLTKEQMLRLTKTFESNFTGKRQHHKTLILPEGMKYNVIEQSPVDSALIEFAKTNKEPILSAYNVPPIKIGLLDGATFANAMIQNKTYYVDTIMPLTTLMEQAINKSKAVMKPTRNLRFRFDFSQIEALQEDLKAKADSGKSMAESGMTINEVREKLWSLPPLEGGDTTPALAKPAPAGGLFSLSAEEGDTKVDAANAQNDTVALADVVPTEASFESRVAQLTEEAITDGLDMGLAVQRAVAQALVEGFKPIEQEDKALQLEEVLVPFSKEALQTYAKILSGSGVEEIIEERKKEYLGFIKRLEKMIIKKIKKKAFRKNTTFVVKASLPDTSDLEKFIETESELIAESVMKASKLGYKANIPTANMAFPNDKALNILKKIAAKNVKSVTTTSLKQLKNVITSSMSDQVSVGELSSRIQESFDNMSKGKADTIARTETLTAVSVGQDLKTREFKSQFPKESKELKRVWITAKDDKVRDSHEHLEGKVVQVGDDFANGLKYPREPGGDAGEVINCRCSFIDFLPEDSDTILSILG